MISFYTRALLLLCRPSFWNKHVSQQGRHSTTQHVAFAVAGPSCYPSQHRADNGHFLQTFQNCFVDWFMRSRRIRDIWYYCAVYNCSYLLTYVTSRLARNVVLVLSWRVVTWRNKWNLGLTDKRDSQVAEGCHTLLHIAVLRFLSIIFRTCNFQPCQFGVPIYISSQKLRAPSLQHMVCQTLLESVQVCKKVIYD